MGVNLNKVAKKANSYEYLLVIMRHAKAEAGSSGGDIDRELSDKGRRQAGTVGKGLAAVGLVPDQIRCSGAVRTRQTLERMLKYFGDRPTVEYRQSLYSGGMQALLDEMTHVKGKTRRLMIVGHDPTVSVASQWLASPKSDQAMLNILGLGMSPASVVIMGSDKPFGKWGMRDGRLIAVLSPKDCS
ncbi:SixA phosphatase family protein [Bifidobacterium catulorum]|uniref:Phosphoglycerate mutase n=1 Tax=Bifidobacterium catulorum TaxID=1630173 RepID=A0A2U2MV31_9BIFI|nr:histidine phosphatase family protein [Bifidobacterium catulorum]PWG60717.1 phosphoglycerate mutase [Bifidobacterium catulorum]